MPLGAFIIDLPSERERTISYICGFRPTTFSQWLPESWQNAIWLPRISILAGLKLQFRNIFDTKAISLLESLNNQPKQTSVAFKIENFMPAFQFDATEYFVPEKYAKLCDELSTF